MNLDNSKLFDRDVESEKVKAEQKMKNLALLNQIKLTKEMQDKLREEHKLASQYNDIIGKKHLEDNFLNDLDSISQSKLSTSQKFSEVNEIQNFFKKNLIEKIKDSISNTNISYYISKINDLTNNCNKDSFDSAFSIKLKCFETILSCKNLNTDHLNMMALSIVSSPIHSNERQKFSKNNSLSVLDNDCQKTLNKIFSHHLFSHKKNAVFMPILYDTFIANVTNPQRKFRAHYSLNYHNLNNRNYHKHLNSNATQLTLNQIKNDGIIFDSFLKSNMKYIENIYTDKQNTLTYLIDKTKGFFAYQDLVNIYLNHNNKLLNSMDENHKTPIQIAKKHSNFFFYESNPIYKVLVKHGASEIKNHSLDLIKKGMHIIKSKNQEVKHITYSEKQEELKEKNDIEKLQDKMNDNMREIKASLSQLKLNEEEKIFLMLDDMLAISIQLTNSSTRTNDEYLFIKSAVLTHLPNFTQDFVDGVKLAHINEKPLFIEEYYKQVSIFHQKVVDSYENIIRNESEDKLDIMKKNTAFLTAKM